MILDRSTDTASREAKKGTVVPSFYEMRMSKLLRRDEPSLAQLGSQSPLRSDAPCEGADDGDVGVRRAELDVVPPGQTNALLPPCLSCCANQLLGVLVSTQTLSHTSQAPLGVLGAGLEGYTRGQFLLTIASLTRREGL